MNKMQKEILNGIRAYSDRQQLILFAIDEAGGELHQDAFDEKFSLDSRFRGDHKFADRLEDCSYILGTLKTSGFKYEMVQLAQLMYAAGILDVHGSPPNVTYSRTKKHEHFVISDGVPENVVMVADIPAIFNAMNRGESLEDAVKGRLAIASIPATPDVPKA